MSVCWSNNKKQIWPSKYGYYKNDADFTRLGTISGEWLRKCFVSLIPNYHIIVNIFLWTPEEKKTRIIETVPWVRLSNQAIKHDILFDILCNTVFNKRTILLNTAVTNSTDLLVSFILNANLKLTSCMNMFWQIHQKMFGYDH